VIQDFIDIELGFELTSKVHFSSAKAGEL